MNSKKIITIISLFLIVISKPAVSTIEKEIDQVAEEAKGHVGVELHVLEINGSIWLTKNDYFPMQSVYKIPIEMAVLAQVDAGIIGLD